MALTTIIRGRFATGMLADGKTPKKGNFVGWNSRGTQIHISKELLAEIGIKTDKDFADKAKGKLFANVETDILEVTDENNVVVGTRERVTAKLVSIEKDKLIETAMEDDLLNIDYRETLEKKIGSATLSEESVRAVLNASSFV